MANFYPAIAAGFSVPVYEVTQSAIHVLVTHAFLRSLAGLDLAKSKVGRFAAAAPGRARRGRPRRASVCTGRRLTPTMHERAVSRNERPSASAASCGRAAPTPAAPSPTASA